MADCTYGKQARESIENAVGDVALFLIIPGKVDDLKQYMFDNYHMCIKDWNIVKPLKQGIGIRLSPKDAKMLCHIHEQRLSDGLEQVIRAVAYVNEYDTCINEDGREVDPLEYVDDEDEDYTKVPAPADDPAKYSLTFKIGSKKRGEQSTVLTKISKKPGQHLKINPKKVH